MAKVVTLCLTMSYCGDRMIEETVVRKEANPNKKGLPSTLHPRTLNYRTCSPERGWLGDLAGFIIHPLYFILHVY